MPARAQHSHVPATGSTLMQAQASKLIAPLQLHLKRERLYVSLARA
jgi:hypothetical protein